MNEGIKGIETGYFDLKIVVDRHSIKESMEGSLSAEGMQLADDRYTQQVRTEPTDKGGWRRWLYAASPKDRAQQTATIEQEARRYVTGIEPAQVQTEDALNEGTIEPFAKECMKQGKNWIQEWHENKDLPDGVPSMPSIAKKFSQWFLQHIRRAKETSRDEGVRAFSHGPLMLAVLVYIEDCMQENIITDVAAGSNRFSRDVLLDMKSGILKALARLELTVNSKNPNIVNIAVNGKNVRVPLQVFEDAADYNGFGGN